MNTQPQVKYVVINENTLGYYCQVVEGGAFDHIQVLAGKPQLGGRNWIDGYFMPSSLDKIRPATQKDFDYYRVCSKGHIA